MQHPQPGDSRHHAQHDTFLIAAFAADDVTPADRERAKSQLAGCHECRALRDDLLAIVAATRAMPAPAAPRDFRLTDAQARGLRPSWRSIVLAPFRPGRAGTRRLAAAFTTFGLVGVFVAGALPAFLGGAATSAPAAFGTGAGGGAASSEAPAAQFGPEAQPTTQGGVPGPKDAAASSAPASAAPAYVISGDSSESAPNGSDTARQAAPSPQNLLLVGSLVLLGAGLVLFVLRSAGRRFR
jgi:hypothetical protein